MTGKWTKGPWKISFYEGGPLTGEEAEEAEMQDCEPFSLSQATITAPEIVVAYRRAAGDRKEPVGKTITQVNYDPRNDNSEEHRANGHVMTAAPELYEALEEASLRMESLGQDTSQQRAALASARGETA